MTEEHITKLIHDDMRATIISNLTTINPRYNAEDLVKKDLEFLKAIETTEKNGLYERVIALKRLIIHVDDELISQPVIV